MGSAEGFFSLGSLPGGNKSYIRTLGQVLQLIKDASELKLETLHHWFKDHYPVRTESSRHYAQILVNLNVVTRQQDRSLRLTPFGAQLLESDETTKQDLVGTYLLDRFVGFADVLEQFANVPEPLHVEGVIHRLASKYPQWNSSSVFAERIYWLLSVEYIEQVKGGFNQITDRGRLALTQFHVQAPTINDQESLLKIETIDVDALIKDLKLFSKSSENFQQLEACVASAFAYLGFQIEQIGRAGDTDVVIRAYLGRETYSAIVDTKARKKGRLNSLDIPTILDHRKKNAANYAVIVANRFGGSTLARHARDNGIVLLPVHVLCQWLEFHRSTPLSLLDYRYMFTVSGVIEEIPHVLQEHVKSQSRWSALILHLSELFTNVSNYGFDVSSSDEQIYALLAVHLKGVRYTEEEVRGAIDFMRHPIIGCLFMTDDQRLVITSDRNAIVQRLRSLADLLTNELKQNPTT